MFTGFSARLSSSMRKPPVNSVNRQAAAVDRLQQQDLAGDLLGFARPRREQQQATQQDA
jgi:hypothetical protein